MQNIIDLKRYPILDQNSPAYLELIKVSRAALRETGLCVLEGFVTPQALSTMCQQAMAKEPQAYYSTVRGNAYLKDNDPNLPSDHAYNLQEETTLGVIAYDQIGKTDVIRQIYESKDVFQFIEKAVGRGPMHYYECPLGKINYSTMRAGDYLRWHFDQSDFVASIPVQDCVGGGKYEYVHNIRNQKNENYDEVKKVLKGDRSRVKILNTPPGSLVLFEGRYTIHRVTPIEGPRIRVMALLGFADRAGVTSTEYLRKIRYGRTQ